MQAARSGRCCSDLPPGPSIASRQQAHAAGLSSGYTGRKIAPLLGQDDMAWLSTLADAHPQSAGVRIKVVDDHRRQLAVTAAGQQGGHDQGTEIGRTGRNSVSVEVSSMTPHSSRPRLSGRGSLSRRLDGFCLLGINVETAPRVEAGAISNHRARRERVDGRYST
jgi:hypothetical protein